MIMSGILKCQVRHKAGRTVGVTAPTGPVRGFFRPRPWAESAAHGRIADGGGPGQSLERHMCWSAAGPRKGGVGCKASLFDYVVRTVVVIICENSH